MNTIDKNRKFQIHLYSTDEVSNVFCYTNYSWYVTSLQTGDELFSFSGSCNEDSSGATESGVSCLSFDNKLNKLVVDYYDSRKESYELPVDVLFGEDNQHIVLQYADGRKETRCRSLAMGISKDGQPFEISPLKTRS